MGDIGDLFSNIFSGPTDSSATNTPETEKKLREEAKMRRREAEPSEKKRREIQELTALKIRREKEAETKRLQKEAETIKLEQQAKQLRRVKESNAKRTENINAQKADPLYNKKDSEKSNNIANRIFPFTSNIYNRFIGSKQISPPVLNNPTYDNNPSIVPHDIDDIKSPLNIIIDMSVDILSFVNTSTLMANNNITDDLLTDKDKQLFPMIIKSLTTTNTGRNININTAIKSLSEIMNKRIIDDEDPYIHVGSFMDSIIEYDKSNNTNVHDFLKTNPNVLNYFLEHEDIIINDRFSHEIFLDKLSAISHSQLHNNYGKSSTASSDGENSVEPEEILDSNANGIIQQNPSNNYWGIPKVQMPNLSKLIPKFSVNKSNPNTIESSNSPSFSYGTKTKDDISSLGTNTSMGVEQSLLSSTKNIEDDIYSAIFTPSEKMVRDKLITEVSNIIKNPDSPDSVHIFTGIINRDITQEDLLIDNKTVISNVYKNLHTIPNIESKIAYVDELTAIVKNYIASLEASYGRTTE